MENIKWKYRIGGNFNGIIPALIVMIIFGGVSVWLYSVKNGAFIFVSVLTALVLLIVAYSTYRFLFVKVLIGEDGFYHQTSPGNGKYYKYTEITEAWKSSGKNQNGTTECYCSYKTVDGALRKFLFSSFESDELDYFLIRINGEESRISGEDKDE